MPRKRKYKKRKSSGGPQKGTIYKLFAFALFLASIGAAVSYLRSGDVLIQINDLLIVNFGFFAFLVPLNLFLFSLLFLRMKTKITQPNIIIGLVLFTIAAFSLFRSGLFGMVIFSNMSAFFGTALTIFISALALLTGIVVILALSPKQIFLFFISIFTYLGEVFEKAILPVFSVKGKSSSVEGEPTIKEYHDPKPEGKTVKDGGPVVQEKSAPPVIKNMKLLESSDPVSDTLVSNKPLEMGVWEYPPLSLLSVYKESKKDSGDVKRTAQKIEDTLKSFGIKAKVVEINVGPSVTQYALEIALGIKVAKITSLSNDLALATEAPTGQIRIEAPIPGRNLVGIEIPNRSLDMVGMRTMLESQVISKAKSKLAVPLGLNISGAPVMGDISKMPHVLIAGTTGSGKSVLMNAIITSLLFRASPAEVRMILIDPKRVEFTGYNDIPHLLAPVVVETQQAVSALKWAMKAMDARYVEFSKHGVKNLEAYNEMAGFQRLPYIVIMIDELADLMALAPAEVEDSIARLAQMARATGIHLVLATQRPSVDVITGLIKANIPCRISFNVSSMIDSKVIIDSPGAEKLLGKGDMLYVPPDQAKPTRIQGTFVSDQDVKRVVNFIKSRGVEVHYTSEVLEQSVNTKRGGGGSAMTGGSGGNDEMFEQAVRLIAQHDTMSVSMLQRRLGIGFNRAANLMEQLQSMGAVGPADGSKPRDVRVRNADEFLAMQNGS